VALFKPLFEGGGGRIDFEKFSLHLDLLVLRIMRCVNTK
jgi:hypothetical protein